jgi:hypothetical protein
MNDTGASGVLLLIAALTASFTFGYWAGHFGTRDAIVNNLCPSGGKVEGVVVYCKVDGGYDEVVW